MNNRNNNDNKDNKNNKETKKNIIIALVIAVVVFIGFIVIFDIIIKIKYSLYLRENINNSAKVSVIIKEYDNGITDDMISEKNIKLSTNEKNTIIACLKDSYSIGKKININLNGVVLSKCEIHMKMKRKDVNIRWIIGTNILMVDDKKYYSNKNNIKLLNEIVQKRLNK